MTTAGGLVFTGEIGQEDMVEVLEGERTLEELYATDDRAVVLASEADMMQLIRAQHASA